MSATQATIVPISTKGFLLPKRVLVLSDIEPNQGRRKRARRLSIAITAPETLSLGAVIGGGIFVLIFAAVLVFLCVTADKETKAEYTLRN